MSILLPHAARARVLAAINDLFTATVYPRIPHTDVAKVREHFEHLRTATKDLETTVKIESSEVVGRTVITIYLDLKEGTPNVASAN